MSAFSWFLALRYLLTRWVNLLGMIGIAVAVWALIVVTAVFSGFIADIRGHIRGATADLVLTGVNANQSYAAIAPVLRTDPDVVATAPRLEHYAILFPHDAQARPVVRTDAAEPSPSNFNFVKVLGVDPDLERGTTEFHRWLEVAVPEVRVTHSTEPFTVPPERLNADQFANGTRVQALTAVPGILLPRRRIVPGANVFLRQFTGPGQSIDLVSARFERTGDEEKVLRVNRRLALAGAFETQHRIFDETYAFVHIETLRSMLGQDERLPGTVDLITEVAIKVREGVDLSAVSNRLEEKLKPLSGGVVRTWEEQNRVFLAAVDQERSLMKFVLFAVMLVAGFLVYSTLHMMVTQKTRDIGVLSALGGTPWSIGMVFVFCGVVIALVGCCLGTISGCLSAIYLNDVNDWCKAKFEIELFPTAVYSLPRIPYSLEPRWILQVIGSAFALALLSAILPARRAARLDPVTALNHE